MKEIKIKTYVKQQPKVGEIFCVEGKAGLFQCVYKENVKCNDCVKGGDCLREVGILCDSSDRDDARDVFFVGVK